MTIRHCVMLSFHDGTTDEQVEALAGSLRELPGQIPEIRSYEVGRDLGWRDENAHLGIVAEFDDRDGWQTYQQHPAHVAIVQGPVAAITASRRALQFEV